jgi:hypothetical protein
MNFPLVILFAEVAAVLTVVWFSERASRRSRGRPKRTISHVVRNRKFRRIY